MSNSLNPDQDRQTVCKGYQQTTRVAAINERAKAMKQLIINVIVEKNPVSIEMVNY